MVGTSSTSVTRRVLNRGHHAFRRERRDHDVGAAAEQQRIHRRAVGEMEHRRGMQIDGRGRKQAFAERVQRVGHQVAVAEHHALRAAGGAAGVEDAGEVGRVAHRVRHRRRFAPAAPRSLPCRPARRRRRHRPASGREALSPARRPSMRTPCRRPARWRGSRACASSFSSGLQRMLSGTITAPAQAVAR